MPAAGQSGPPQPWSRSPMDPSSAVGLGPSPASVSSALRGWVAPRVPVTPWGQNTRLPDQVEIGASSSA